MYSSTSNLSLRILLISTIVLSSATAILIFPTVLTFVTHDIPLIWSIILSWLKPPYLYVVINAIILTIVASSRFQHHYNNYNQDNKYPPLVHETGLVETEILPLEPLPLVEPGFDGLEHPTVVYEVESRDLVVYEVEPPVLDIETVPETENDVVDEGEDKFVVSRSMEMVPVTVREMPLVSSRFAHQRRMAKVNPEGVRSLRVTKPRKHETLESTWKMITDGRHMPLNRHHRKSGTFDGHNREPSLDVYPDEQGPRALLPPSGGKLRKEGSLSQDELNRRVEAFIKKFNEDMRLQRQESLKQYMDMINRGV